MVNHKQKIETTEKELILEREFDAPRELVFEVYSSCEHLKHWWGPRQWPMAECSMDFRVGGEWHFCLRGPEGGDESWGKAIFKEIKKPELIVYNDYFSDKDGTINQDMPGMLITVKFKESDGKTKLISTTLFSTPEELQKSVEMGVVEGFTETLDRLDELLAEMQ